MRVFSIASVAILESDPLHPLLSANGFVWVALARRKRSHDKAGMDVLRRIDNRPQSCSLTSSPRSRNISRN